jgi:Coenzyme PQQ synthesis protein D (PqqD)
MASPDERLTQRSGIETRPYAKGALLVDMDTGRCYRLNHVGAEIWSLLRRPLVIAEVCAEVAQQYEHAPQQIEGDVRSLVADLVKERLLIPAPAETAR